MEKLNSCDALAKAIRQYPTLKAFSAAVGVKYQVVQQWLINGVPAEYCPKIEKLTNGTVRCESLNDRVDWAYIRGIESAASPRDIPSLDDDAPPSRGNLMSLAIARVLT